MDISELNLSLNPFGDNNYEEEEDDDPTYRLGDIKTETTEYSTTVR